MRKNDDSRTKKLRRQLESLSVLGMTKQSLVIFVTSIILAILVLGVLIVVAAYVNNPDSITATLKRVKDDAIIQVLEEFDESETWKVPDWITNDGRALVTMSGGGGGGCSGGAVHYGGGGNSGVSTVRYPVSLAKRDFCRIVIGSGGASNVDGAETTLVCTADDAKEHVNLAAQGGRSGCTFFNGTQPRRGESKSYPFVAERIGGKPVSGYAAEAHPYGGAPGDASGGGAGSVFGDGGDGATKPLEQGESPDSHGAGGGGGGQTGGIGGSGKSGKVVIVYYAQVKN